MYFLTRLLVLGVIGDTMLNLTHGVSLDDLCDRNWYAFVSMHSSYILVCDIEILQTRAIAVMVLFILGSSGPCDEGNLLWVVQDVLDLGSAWAEPC